MKTHTAPTNSAPIIVVVACLGGSGMSLVDNFTPDVFLLSLVWGVFAEPEKRF